MAGQAKARHIGRAGQGRVRQGRAVQDNAPRHCRA
jgi:hypothetical protein